MDVLLAGNSVNAELIGEGRPIVLLHSLLAGRASFDRIKPSLTARFRVIIPQLPGFGRSLAARGDLPSVADRVAEAVREACSGEKPVVLGNGYGAFVALQMVIRHPDLASRLVLAGCGMKFSDQGRAAFRTMSSVAAEKGLEAIAETAMRRLFAPDFQAANPALLSECRTAFLGTKLEVFQAACATLAGLDLEADLPKVRLPVLALVGEQDEATPPHMSRELVAGLPDAKLVILPGCAHVPQLQAPESFLGAIHDFVS